MGLRILAGNLVNEGREARGAVLYCSTTMTALSWIFKDEEDAESFLQRYGDIRGFSGAEQEKMYEEWRTRDHSKENDHSDSLDDDLDL